jgi:hypothetical protein
MAKDYFGAFFRRMRARLGTAQAITATAHKLSRVVYHVLQQRTYTETVFHRCDEQEQQRAEMRANTPHNSASNSYPSQQTQQLSS